MNWEDNISEEEKKILLNALNTRIESLSAVIDRSKESVAVGWKSERAFLEKFIEKFINDK